MSKPPTIFSTRSTHRAWESNGRCPGSGCPPRPGTTGAALPPFAQCPSCWRRLALAGNGTMRTHAP